MYKDKDEAMTAVVDFLNKNSASVDAMASGKSNLREKQCLTIVFPTEDFAKSVDVRKYNVKTDDGTNRSGEWFAVRTLEGYEISLARLIRLGNGLDFITGMTNSERVKSLYTKVWDNNEQHTLKLKIAKIETRISNGREFKTYSFEVVE